MEVSRNFILMEKAFMSFFLIKKVLMMKIINTKNYRTYFFVPIFSPMETMVS